MMMESKKDMLRKIDYEIRQLKTDIGFMNTIDIRVIGEWVLSTPEVMEQFLEEFDDDRKRQIEYLKKKKQEIKEECRQKMIREL